MDKKIVLSFTDRIRDIEEDIEVPSDLTGEELLHALNQGFGLGLLQEELQRCFLKAENPIALLKGNRTLEEYGLRNGSRIRCRE